VARILNLVAFDYLVVAGGGGGGKWSMVVEVELVVSRSSFPGGTKITH
jgi:hypothetical protein